VVGVLPLHVNVVHGKAGLRAECASGPALARETVADRDSDRLSDRRHAELSTAARGFTARHERRGPDSNRCKRLCRPLPNHSVTAPGALIVSAPEISLGRIRPTCAEWTHAASCEPCPGVDGAGCGWSPGPLPGLRYSYGAPIGPVQAGASRRRARRRAVVRERRSARRPAASSAASSPLRARRRRSRCRSRSYARWLSGFTLTRRRSPA
jgi:hypothetical protein